MERIFFALGYEPVENKIKQRLDEAGFQYEIVYTAVHKEAVIQNLPSKAADILILREGLEGRVNIFTLASQIKRKFPNLRIIFLAADHKPGDPAISNLIAFNIYDILVGQKLSVSDIVELIIHPNKFEDVAQFMPDKNDIFNSDDFGDIDSELEKVKGEISTSQTTSININAPFVEAPKGGNEDIQISTVNIKKKKSGTLPVPPEAPVKPVSKNEDEEQEYDDDIDISNIPIDEPPVKKKGLLSGFSSKKPKTTKITEPIEDEEPEEDYEEMKRQSKDKGRGSDGNDWRGYHTKDGRSVGTKQQLTVFFSPKGGIGTTTIAINAAAEAARRGHQKVLFIEFNTFFSAVNYWFDLPNSGFGLEDALVSVGTNYTSLNKAIITKKKILEYGTQYVEGVKKFPDTLDFLVFSDKFYKKTIKPSFNPSSLDKLITYCLYTLNYDDIYLDMNAYTDREIIDSCLISSGKNVILLSQDVAIINNVVMFFYELNRMGVKFDVGLNDEDDRKKEQITYKNIYVVNKNSRSSFTPAKIKEWIGCKNICSIPESGGEINDALSAGYIPLTVSKNGAFKESFKLLGNLIEK